MKDQLVFDIGMHKGQDTAYYLHQGFRVVAVEANPVLAQQCAVRFEREIKNGRLHIENVGISDYAKTAKFWICEEMSEWSSFDRAIASRRGYKHHAIQVQCIQCSQLIKKYGMPLYLKIDIEGNDQLCLQNLSREQSPHYVSVESYGEEAICDLRSLGYAKFKIIDQICFCTLEAPPTLSYSAYWQIKLLHDRSLFDRTAYLSRLAGKLGGRYLAQAILKRYRSIGGYHFEDGSSGPFGEKTRGRWISAETAISAINGFDRWHQTTGEEPEKRWFDIHATR